MSSPHTHPSEFSLVYCDRKGNVFDFPGKLPAFRTGVRTVMPDFSEFIPMPYGSTLFSLPDRLPVYCERRDNSFHALRRSPDGRPVWAASAFLSSAYLRTLLPAFQSRHNASLLPLWAYCGVAFHDESFYVPAIRIDDDERSDPSIHENNNELLDAIGRITRDYPSNRLIRQLTRCSTEYGCLCARNFFLSRHEAPIPTSRACNARCLGCLSLQKDSGFSESQYRIDFNPTPGEIAETMLHHALRVDNSVMSFGQGCEGEPLLRGSDLASAIRMVREKTDRGTIHLNTNGSLPSVVSDMIDAGLDSIRVSLNSPSRHYYDRYFRQQSYSFDDVMRTISIALEAGIIVSINLFFLPGFTDMETEVSGLFSFLERFPVSMIQTRNLNIDPDFYLSSIGFTESPPIGIGNLITLLRDKYPAIRLGYYNPPRESFIR